MAWVDGERNIIINMNNFFSFFCRNIKWIWCGDQNFEHTQADERAVIQMTNKSRKGDRNFIHFNPHCNNNRSTFLFAVTIKT